MFRSTSLLLRQWRHCLCVSESDLYNDVIKWKHFWRYWLFVWGIHRPAMRSFDVFFDLRLNKQLSKQSWGWWFETPSRTLWRHCNGVTRVNRSLEHTTHLFAYLKIWVSEVISACVMTYPGLRYLLLTRKFSRSGMHCAYTSYFFCSTNTCQRQYPWISTSISMKHC